MDRNRHAGDRATAQAVALRKESVDRNTLTRCASHRLSVSLSARRAWIEIWWLRCWKLAARVALRKESVDRNMPSHWRMSRTGGRSPQGERG